MWYTYIKSYSSFIWNPSLSAHPLHLFTKMALTAVWKTSQNVGEPWRIVYQQGAAEFCFLFLWLFLQGRPQLLTWEDTRIEIPPSLWTEENQKKSPGRLERDKNIQEKGEPEKGVPNVYEKIQKILSLVPKLCMHRRDPKHHIKKMPKWDLIYCSQKMK